MVMDVALVIMVVAYIHSVHISSLHVLFCSYSIVHEVASSSNTR